MAISATLSIDHLALLQACADRLGVTPEQAVERAITRLHMALFNTNADPADVDLEQGAAEPSGAGVTVKTLPTA